MSEVICDCTSLKCLPMFRSFIKAAKHIHHTKLGIMVFIDFLKYYLVFALLGLGSDNDVSRVKRGRWNKKFWETLFQPFAGHD